tara:strand:- start:111 stop:293 length:183 start_codon:yes stop_codon:yes gene_type:complete
MPGDKKVKKAIAQTKKGKYKKAAKTLSKAKDSRAKNTATSFLKRESAMKQDFKNRMANLR